MKKKILPGKGRIPAATRGCAFWQFLGCHSLPGAHCKTAPGPSKRHKWRKGALSRPVAASMFLSMFPGGRGGLSVLTP